jgi:hypothetical protein
MRLEMPGLPCWAEWVKLVIGTGGIVGIILLFIALLQIRHLFLKSPNIVVELAEPISNYSYATPTSIFCGLKFYNRSHLRADIEGLNMQIEYESDHGVTSSPMIYNGFDELPLNFRITADTLAEITAQIIKNPFI